MINLSNTNISHSFYPGIDLTGIRLGVGSKAGGVPPDLFFDPSSFDQAWTVTGLTNDSPNKTTVKNLTGNGIDLTLNNFAFSKNSGYGLYISDFTNWKANGEGVTLNKTASSISVTTEARVNGLVTYISNEEWNVTKVRKLKVTSSDFVTGEVNINYYVGAGGGEYVELKVNGITEIPANPDFTGRIYLSLPSNKSGSVTVEEVPDYEGYLVMDGVDDSVTSPNFNLYDDFTFVGEWKLLPEGSGKNAGIVKSKKLYIYNIVSGMLVTINSTSINNKIQGIKSLKAVCSDGRVYDENWNEFQLNVGENSRENSPIVIGSSAGNNLFTTLAFKNGAFYSDRLLTKEQCIKSYDYLQTLKHP